MTEARRSRPPTKVGSTGVLGGWSRSEMMDRVLTRKLVQARKHYPCDACYWWDRSEYRLDDCETSEQRLIVEAAKADRWRILPGQMYLKVTGVFEGAMTTYRARPGMQQVLRELGLDED